MTHPTAPTTGTDTTTRALWVALVVLVVAALALGGVLVVRLGSEEDSASPDAEPVLLEPLGSEGPDPFTASTTVVEVGSFPETLDTVPSAVADAAAEGGVTLVGTVPGLYGGTRDDAACDAAALVDFLEQNPEKAEAWAGALGLDAAEIGDYVGGLAPAVLTADIRVTNHGFAGGAAVARQSVLQAGTAVLVDATGTPRVRCSCGNPLDLPAGGATELEGTPWAGFDESTVLTVRPGDAVDTLSLVDLAGGDLFTVPVGDGATWVAVSGGTPNPSGVSTGDDGAVHLSRDGRSWEQVATVPASLNGVAQGDGTFVAVGAGAGGGVTISSADGREWSSPAAVDEGLRAVAYGAGRWVAISDTRPYVSTDGRTWTAGDPFELTSSSLDYVPPFAATVTYEPDAGGDGSFVVVTATCGGSACVQDLVLTSADGSTWTAGGASPGQDARSALAWSDDDAAFGLVGPRWSEVGPGDPMSSRTEEAVAGTWVPDGTFAEVAVDPPDLVLDALTAAAGTWIAVDAGADSSTFVASDDLSAWTAIGTVGARVNGVAITGRVGDVAGGPAEPLPSPTTAAPTTAPPTSTPATAAPTTAPPTTAPPTTAAPQGATDPETALLEWMAANGRSDRRYQMITPPGSSTVVYEVANSDFSVVEWVNLRQQGGVWVVVAVNEPTMEEGDF